MPCGCLRLILLIMEANRFLILSIVLTLCSCSGGSSEISESLYKPHELACRDFSSYFWGEYDSSTDTYTPVEPVLIANDGDEGNYFYNEEYDYYFTSVGFGPQTESLTMEYIANYIASFAYRYVLYDAVKDRKISAEDYQIDANNVGHIDVTIDKSIYGKDILFEAGSYLNNSKVVGLALFKIK